MTAKVKSKQVIEGREERGRIVIEPVRELAFDLNTLLAGITDENRHDEVDFEGPTGKER